MRLSEHQSVLRQVVLQLPETAQQQITSSM